MRMLFALSLVLVLAAATEPKSVAATDAQVERGTEAEMAGQFEEAATLYRSAADKGDPKAQSALGGLYLSGNVPGGFAEALRWYRLAAAQNDPDGQFGLGMMYENGWGVPESYAEALSWFTKAAQNGSAVAAESVGMFYLNGLGVAPDFEKARPWFHQAIAGGNTSPEPLLCDPFRTGFAAAEKRADHGEMDRLIAQTDEFCPELLRYEKAARDAVSQPTSPQPER